MRMTLTATTDICVSGIRQDATGTICVNRLRAGLDARHLHHGHSMFRSTMFRNAVARVAGYCAISPRMLKPAMLGAAEALGSLCSLALEARSRRRWLRQRPVGIVPVA
jgi:hypothetical protein